MTTLIFCRFILLTLEFRCLGEENEQFVKHISGSLQLYIISAHFIKLETPVFSTYGVNLAEFDADLREQKQDHRAFKLMLSYQLNSYTQNN